MPVSSSLYTVDCWDGQDVEPIVHHGYTLTSKILFKDVIETINKYAFIKNEYVYTLLPSIFILFNCLTPREPLNTLIEQINVTVPADSWTKMHEKIEKDPGLKEQLKHVKSKMLIVVIEAHISWIL